MLTGGDAVVYLTLKGEADDYLRSRDLYWTVLRPAMLTGDPGTDRILVGTGLPLGSIPGPTSPRCWRGSSPIPTACAAGSRSPAAKRT